MTERAVLDHASVPLPRPPEGFSAAIGLGAVEGPAAPDFLSVPRHGEGCSWNNPNEQTAWNPAQNEQNGNAFWPAALRKYHGNSHGDFYDGAAPPLHTATMQSPSYSDAPVVYQHPHQAPQNNWYGYKCGAAPRMSPVSQTAHLGAGQGAQYAPHGYSRTPWEGYSYGPHGVGASIATEQPQPSTEQQSERTATHSSTLTQLAATPEVQIPISEPNPRPGLSGLAAREARAQGAGLNLNGNGSLSYGNQPVPTESGTGRYASVCEKTPPPSPSAPSVGFANSGSTGMPTDWVHRATMESVHTIEGESPRATGLDCEPGERGGVARKWSTHSVEFAADLRGGNPLMDVIGFQGDGQNCSGAEGRSQGQFGEGLSGLASSSFHPLGDTPECHVKGINQSSSKPLIPLEVHTEAKSLSTMPRRAAVGNDLSSGDAVVTKQGDTSFSRRSPRLNATRKRNLSSLRSTRNRNSTLDKRGKVGESQSGASPEDVGRIPNDIPMGALDAPGILVQNSENALTHIPKTGGQRRKAIPKMDFDSPDEEQQASQKRTTLSRGTRASKTQPRNKASLPLTSKATPGEKPIKRKRRPTERKKATEKNETQERKKAVTKVKESVFASIDGNTREKARVPKMFSDDEDDDKSNYNSVFQEAGRDKISLKNKNAKKRPKARAQTDRGSVFTDNETTRRENNRYGSEKDNSDDDFIQSQNPARKRSLSVSNGGGTLEVKRSKRVSTSPRKASGGRKETLSQTRASPRKPKASANLVDDVEPKQCRTGAPSEDEETDGDACSPSQGGSQTMSIVVEALPVKKKRVTKYPEHLWTRMTSDELSTIRKGFVKYYPTPPSNMHAQGRFEQQYMREMPKAMVEALWKNELKPWSDRWWKFFTMFGDFSREKKKQKPLGKNPTLKQLEVDRWAKEFHAKHGDARLPAEPKTVEANNTAAGDN